MSTDSSGDWRAMWGGSSLRDSSVADMTSSPPVLTEQTKELAHDVGMEVAAGLHRSAEKAQSTFVAQLDPKSTVREGERIELVLDTSRFHFFDPETGLGIYGE